jgi:GH25 family lysozyme M1 (1,4-beta-N-acetylmuramidase)
MEQGRKFVEEESRAQRLIEYYCDMCERAEQNGISSRQKLNMQKEGQNLMDELAKQDKITSDEVEMILEDC